MAHEKPSDTESIRNNNSMDRGTSNVIRDLWSSLWSYTRPYFYTGVSLIILTSTIPDLIENAHTFDRVSDNLRNAAGATLGTYFLMTGLNEMYNRISSNNRNRLR